MQVVKKKEPEWLERIKVLIDTIKIKIDNPSEKTIYIVQLFY
jgi:hypothetical protein